MVSFVPVSVSTRVLPPVFRAHRPDDGGRNDAHVRQNKGNSQQPDRRLRGGAVEVAALRRVPLRTVRFLQVCGSISRKYDENLLTLMMLTLWYNFIQQRLFAKVFLTIVLKSGTFCLVEQK